MLRQLLSGVTNCFLGEINIDFEPLSDGKLINFLSYYFKIEIIYIGTAVSMNDLFRTSTARLYLCYLRDGLKKS